MALSEKDLGRWRDRLRYTKHVYREMGLLGGERYSRMRLLIEFYRGNHWGHLGAWGGLDDSDLSCINKTFSVGNRILASTAARNPRVRFFPRNQNAVPLVQGAEALINYDIEELNMIRPFNAALRDHLAAPVGLVRHGFTPEEEMFDDSGSRISSFAPARPDRPWVRREPIWNVLLDPDAVSWGGDGDLWWVMFRSLMTEEQIKRNPNMRFRQGLKAQGISEDYKRLLPRVLREGQPKSPDVPDLIEVWTVYESRNRTWFQMTEDGINKPLRDEDDWPLPWENLPVNVLGVNEQMDTPFPVPILDQAIPIQMELDKLETIMGLLTKMLRRVIVANKEKFGDEWDKLTDGELLEWYGVSGDVGDAVRDIKVGGFPQELLARRATLEEDIREIAGTSRMDLAQRINVETATEAGRVAQGSDVLSARYQAEFERFMKDALRTYVQARRATTTEEELVPVIGVDEAGKLGQQWLTVTPETLAGEFDFEVVVGSTLPKDRDREAQRALADLQVAAQFPDVFDVAKAARRYAEARGQDPLEALTPQAAASSTVRALDEIVGDSTDRRSPQPVNLPPELAAVGGG